MPRAAGSPAWTRVSSQPQSRSNQPPAIHVNPVGAILVALALGAAGRGLPDAQRALLRDLVELAFALTIRVLHAVVQLVPFAVLAKVGSLLDISLGMSPDATGRENIFLRGMLQGLSRREITALVPGIIEFSGLGDFIELPMRTYSSGMLLRLAFSIATVLAPDILLMDEWLAVGDAEFQAKAEERLHDVVSRTSILVIASHSAELIRSQCTRVLYLEHGRLVADLAAGSLDVGVLSGFRSLLAVPVATDCRANAFCCSAPATW